MELDGACFWIFAFYLPDDCYDVRLLIYIILFTTFLKKQSKCWLLLLRTNVKVMEDELIVMIFFGVQCILCNPQSLTIWFYAYLGHLLGSKTKFQHKISQACKFGASVSNKISRQVNKSRNSQACKFGASVSNKIISIPLFACLWLL